MSVDNVHSGATLQIWSKTAQGMAPISNLVTMVATQGTINVTPYLQEGSEVFVKQWACSDVGVLSAPNQVVAHPPLTSPKVLGPVMVGDTSVEVVGGVPGALIEVYEAGDGGSPEYLGHAVATTLSPLTRVSLSIPHQERETVFARQLLCNLSSDDGEPTPVSQLPAYGPRPFYVMAHNPNTINDIRAALQQGANAVEPDVNIYKGTNNEFCISDAGLSGHKLGDSSSPALIEFLQQLNQAAIDFPHLALVVFDCKPATATAANGVYLLGVIRQYLTNSTNLNIVISVDSLSETAMFENIVNDLGPREGVMVDGENDPVAVSNYFTGAGIVNQSFGNGITHETFLGPNVRPSMERVCEFRAAMDRTRFIYVWTVNSDDHMREYIRIGVDSIDTDDVSSLLSVTQEPEFANMIRLATRVDDPYRPPNFAYGLYMHTSDKWMAGTDANVTFTLNGANGSSSKTVNTELPYRMESDDWNYVTVPSPDLGTLSSITIEHDNSGNGPDWHLDSIYVQSWKFGVNLSADYNCWVPSNTAMTRPLHP